jgi:exodeoxyribonuclease V alpha subunit
MQTANNYDKNVFNGDLGSIVAIDRSRKHFVVAFENSRQVEYAFDDADQLNLAYAITIHKSQGSEFPAVVIPLLTQHYMMLQRNLLYTGMTRARKLLILIGSAKAVEMAVKNIRMRPRYSQLPARLKELS